MEKNFDNLDLAWAAGIIDGEGYVGLLNSSVKRLKDGTPERYPEIRVSVDNYDNLMVDKLCLMFGGSRYSRNIPRCRKTIHRWLVACKKAENCLRLIEPYLVTKKKQAEFALSYRDWTNECVSEAMPYAERHPKDAWWVQEMKKLKI